jgi:hypothetical protein
MKRTQRGFAIYTDLKEERGVSLRVQKSSIADRRRVWIFLDAADSKYEKMEKVGKAAAHLSPKEARRVAKALLRFAEGKD